MFVIFNLSLASPNDTNCPYMSVHERTLTISSVPQPGASERRQGEGRSSTSATGSNDRLDRCVSSSDFNHRRECAPECLRESEDYELDGRPESGTAIVLFAALAILFPRSKRGEKTPELCWPLDAPRVPLEWVRFAESCFSPNPCRQDSRPPLKAVG